VAGTSIVAEHIDQDHFGHLPDDPALWRLVDSSRTAFHMAGHGDIAMAHKVRTMRMVVLRRVID